MLGHRFGLLAIILLGVAGCQEAVSETKLSETKANGKASRSDTLQAAAAASARHNFEFIYGATITDLTPGALADVWIPLATDTHEQQVQRLDDRMLLPAAVTAKMTTEKRFGNRIMYFQARADADGKIGPIRIVYQVCRKEISPSQTEIADQDQIAEFLKASKKVPVDGTVLARLYHDGRPTGDAITIGRALYNKINSRMKYDKPVGQPWGRGDALWACDSRFGNCTDFHSQFNGAMRDLGIASKFEIGFTIPNDPAGHGPVGGYHCWAKFVSGGRWIPVDISEANKILTKISAGDPKLVDYYFGHLAADRLTFTTGRDLRLDPPTAQGPVNFLVYPYVEVNGQWHKTFEKQFSYRNL